MAALILFALLFLCGFVFFPSSKTLPWLRSLLLSALPPPKSNPNPPTPHLKNHNLDPNHKALFATFDSDGDGYISATELHHSLRRLGLHAAGDDEDLMGIDLGEFGELCASLGSEGGDEGEGDQELREAFEVFDGNGDGMITVEELGLVLKSLGLGEGNRVEACREMIGRVDLDGDGMVNFPEFKRMMVSNGGGIIL